MTTETLPRGEFTPKLGLKKARPGSVNLKLDSILSKPDLPSTPRNFGSYDVIPEDQWLMLGNDKFGCCAWATEAHLSMLRTDEIGDRAPFDEACVLSDYSRQTGFTPTDPSTDRGTDLDEQAQYLRKVGIIDQKGRRHKIGAYAEPDLSPAKLSQAAYLFSGVNVGFRVYQSAMDQFDAGETWDIDTPEGDFLGGHSVALVGKHAGKYAFVTWGRLQWATSRWIRRYVDQAVVGLSPDVLSTKGKNIHGLDQAALAHYIGELG